MVVSVLRTLQGASESDARRFPSSADHHNGRASGLATAIELLTKDETHWRTNINPKT